MDNNNDIYKASRIYYIIEETSAYLITLLLSGAYFAKLTLHLGFSDSLTALLSSFVNLGCIFQLLAISIFKQGRAKRKVTVFYTVSEFLFLLLYVTPFIKIGYGIRSVLFTVFLLGGYFILNIASSPKTNWFMALIPDKTRGRFTALKEGISLVCGIVFKFFMGLLIDYYEKTGNTTASFIACGFVIFILMLIHTLSLIFSKEKEPVPAQNTSYSLRNEYICTADACIYLFHFDFDSDYLCHKNYKQKQINNKFIFSDIKNAPQILRCIFQFLSFFSEVW